MNRTTLSFSALFLFFCPISLFAQQRIIDSLYTVLKTEKDDTLKVNTMNLLSEKFWRISKYDSSMAIANRAHILAEKITFKKGNAAALRNFAIVYWCQGKYTEALKYQQQSLAINREIGNNRGIAANLGNIGSIYKDEGDYVKALDYYQQGLKMDNESGDKSRINGDLGNIGIIYHIQGDYPKSLDYYLRALKIDEEINDKSNMGRHLGNIGNIYVDEKDYTKALDYFLQSLKLDQETGDKSSAGVVLSNIGNLYADQNNLPKSLDYYNQALTTAKELGEEQLQAITMGNIGNIYADLKDNDKAMEFYNRAIKIDEEIGDKNGLGTDFGNLGSLYIQTENYKKAEFFLKKAIALEDTMGALNDLRQNEIIISQLYTITKQYELALDYFKKASVINDTLFNKDKSNALTRKEISYQFEKKEAIEKAEQDKKEALSEADARKQKIITVSVAMGMILVLVFSGFIFRSLRITRKQKSVIERQKSLVEEQKKIVEEKNKDILDSITYAKRLQDAILPPLSVINKYLPESFVLYKPKDIVAGDFYWMEQSPSQPSPVDILFIAAADCTGHGVPGAMVSVVCSNALNRAVKEFHLTEPGKILDKVRELVMETFEKSESNVQDGMDISLLAISYQPLAINWAGANNPLWYIHLGEMHEIEADKQPIGKHDKPTLFSTHNLKLQKGDTLYLFTDGYADQFGGDKGKKFKYKKLQELLLANSYKPMTEQKIILDATIEKWKGNLEQVDDVLIMGIKV